VDCGRELRSRRAAVYIQHRITAGGLRLSNMEDCGLFVVWKTCLQGWIKRYRMQQPVQNAPTNGGTVRDWQRESTMQNRSPLQFQLYLFILLLWDNHQTTTDLRSTNHFYCSKRWSTILTSFSQPMKNLVRAIRRKFMLFIYSISFWEIKIIVDKKDIDMIKCCLLLSFSLLLEHKNVFI